MAGNGTAGYFGDNGLAVAAELNHPAGVAIDAVGNLFIADFANHVIRMVTKDTGMITTVAGNGTAGYFGDKGLAVAAELNRPAGVAIDAVGNLFIADIFNQRIRSFDTSSSLTAILSRSPTSAPSSLVTVNT